MDWQSIIEHPLFSVAALVVGVVGLAFGVVGTRRSRRVKALRYATAKYPVLEEWMFSVVGMDVDVWGSEKQSKTASVVKMVFWNSGTETISGDDWPELAPLLIEVDGGVDILGVKITYVSHMANEVRVGDVLIMKESGNIGIEFAYLDPGEGFAVRLAHTGVEDHGVTVTGKLKGAGRLKEWVGPSQGKRGEPPIGANMSHRDVLWMSVVPLSLAAAVTYLVLREFPGLSALIALPVAIVLVFYLQWRMSAAGSIPWPLRRYLLLKPEVTKEAPIERDK